MQTKISKLATLISLTVVAVMLSANAMGLEAGNGVTVTPLMKTTTAWDGKSIVYPRGKVEITAMRVDIAPGAETGWHKHGIPSFAVIQEGELEVRLEDGRTKSLRAGDVLAEVVDVPHNGRNIGAVPVKLVVFYAGAEGKPLTVKQAPADGAR